MHPKLLESTIAQCRAYLAAGDCHGEAPPVERLIAAVAQLAPYDGPGAPGATDAERAAWLADKIVAQGDYAKEAAAAYFGAKKMVHKGFINEAMSPDTSVNPERVPQPLLP